MSYKKVNNLSLLMMRVVGIEQHWKSSGRLRLLSLLKLISLTCLSVVSHHTKRVITFFYPIGISSLCATTFRL